MPRTRRLLDSSPVEIPTSKSRPPRRAAALAALPTPPRTQTKRKRGSAHSKASRATDSDEGEQSTLPPIKEEQEQDDAHTDDQTERRVVDGAIFVGNKKRKTLDALVAELSEKRAEDDFWLGPSTSALKPSSPKREENSRSRSRQRSESPVRSPSSSPAALLRRKKQKGTGLISPPPSRRQTRLSEAPVTPPPRPVRQPLFQQLPERDSPNNPFLDDSTPGSDPGSSPPLPVTPLPHVEKPILTYVFRGHKAYCRNPLYKGPGEPSEEEDQSRLPESHPDFSPSSSCPPKLLWPEVRTRDHARLHQCKSSAGPHAEGRAKRSRQQSSKEQIPSEWDSTDDEQEHDTADRFKQEVHEPDESTAALENVLAQRITRRTGTTNVSEEAPRTRTRASRAPRLPDKDRSDPVRRAIGPVRPGGG